MQIMAILFDYDGTLSHTALVKNNNNNNRIPNELEKTLWKISEKKIPIRIVTCDKQILAGMTFDYRYEKDCRSYR
jgi:hydroxymethylpyrimidine pyrophosphatase-like HAD family hydrolase